MKIGQLIFSSDISRKKLWQLKELLDQKAELTLAKSLNVLSFYGKVQRFFLPSRRECKLTYLCNCKFKVFLKVLSQMSHVKGSSGLFTGVDFLAKYTSVGLDNCNAPKSSIFTVINSLLLFLLFFVDADDPWWTFSPSESSLSMSSSSVVESMMYFLLWVFLDLLLDSFLWLTTSSFLWWWWETLVSSLWTTLDAGGTWFEDDEVLAFLWGFKIWFISLALFLKN